MCVIHTPHVRSVRLPETSSVDGAHLKASKQIASQLLRFYLFMYTCSYSLYYLLLIVAIYILNCTIITRTFSILMCLLGLLVFYIMCTCFSMTCMTIHDTLYTCIYMYVRV